MAQRGRFCIGTIVLFRPGGLPNCAHQCLLWWWATHWPSPGLGTAGFWGPAWPQHLCTIIRPNMRSGQLVGTPFFWRRESISSRGSSGVQRAFVCRSAPAHQRYSNYITSPLELSSPGVVSTLSVSLFALSWSLAGLATGRLGHGPALAQRGRFCIGTIVCPTGRLLARYGVLGRRIFFRKGPHLQSLLCHSLLLVRAGLAASLHHRLRIMRSRRWVVLAQGVFSHWPSGAQPAMGWRSVPVQCGCPLVRPRPDCGAGCTAAPVHHCTIQKLGSCATAPLQRCGSALLYHCAVAPLH